MLVKSQTAAERFGGVSNIIDSWLQERQQLVKIYCQLTGLHPAQPRPVWESIQRFCQLLVDYASKGHFEVYEQLMLEGQDFQDGSDEIAGVLIPKLEQNTQHLMDFHDFVNEKCNLHELADKVVALGEHLEARFEMEDEMIEILHNAHRDLVKG